MNLDTKKKKKGDSSIIKLENYRGSNKDTISKDANDIGEGVPEASSSLICWFSILHSPDLDKNK